MIVEKWRALSDKTNELTLRERGIVAGTLIVVVIFAWLQLYYSGYEKQVKKLTNQKNSLVQKKVTQSETLVELTTTLDNDPNKKLREEQSHTQAELALLKLEIENRLSNLIAPEKMADVMKSVLSDYKGLELESARNLEVLPLTLGSSQESRLGEGGSASAQTNNNALANPATDQAVIFAHGFEMVLKGGYFRTIEFLQRLESMSGFYWRQLDYDVESYPDAKITIQISTLSLEEAWIGV